MKRTVSILLSLLMLLPSMAACGESKENADPALPPAVTTEEAQPGAEDAEPAAEEDAIPAPDIPEDADYITIYLGINDSHHEHGKARDGEDPTGIIPLGEMDDTGTATYCGAWNEVLSWLIVNRPFAHIGILVSNGCDRPAYREVQIAMAKKYGIPYIDMNGDRFTPVMIRSQNPDISPEVKQMVMLKQAVDYPRNNHPNDAAHAYESTFIEEFLRRI